MRLQGSRPSGYAEVGRKTIHLDLPPGAGEPVWVLKVWPIGGEIERKETYADGKQAEKAFSEAVEAAVKA